MKTIICGTDGSPGARSAVRVAALLAQRMSAPLVAVHVRDRTPAEGDTAEQAARCRCDRRADAPDEWGRQSFPASDPPQNW